MEHWRYRSAFPTRPTQAHIKAAIAAKTSRPLPPFLSRHPSSLPCPLFPARGKEESETAVGSTRGASRRPWSGASSSSSYGTSGRGRTWTGSGSPSSPTSSTGPRSTNSSMLPSAPAQSHPGPDTDLKGRGFCKESGRGTGRPFRMRYTHWTKPDGSEPRLALAQSTSLSQLNSG